MPQRRWAIEDAPSIADVLAGDADYDDLDPDEQAQVRAAWRERIQEAVDEVDVTAEKAAEGEMYAVADGEGEVVVVHPEFRGRCGRGE